MTISPISPLAHPLARTADARTADDRSGSDPEHQRARLVVLGSVPRLERAILIGVGLKFTTVDRVGGTDRASIKIVRHGPVELAASQAAAANANAGAVARVIRAAAEQVADRARLEDLRPLSGLTLGGGAAGSVIMLGADGRSRATAGEVRAATDMLAATWLAARKQNQPCTAVESMMICAAVLGAVLDQLAVAEIVIDGEGAGARTNPAG